MLRFALALFPLACTSWHTTGDGDTAAGKDSQGFHSDESGCADETCATLDLGSPGSVAVSAACWHTPEVEVADPWSATIDFQYTSGGAGVVVMPAVGNLDDDDDDGDVDENDIPEIVFTTWSSDTLVVLDGATGSPSLVLDGFDGQAGPAVADVDADGEPEIVAFQQGGTIAAVDMNGAVEWVSPSGSVQSYPQVAVADLDNDGMPEVVGDTLVVNGEDGTLVAELEGVTNSWRTPVCADLDLDGREEIILGNQVYDDRGVPLWSDPGVGAGSFAAVADIDGDPEGEVIVVSGSMAYLHDDDGALITSFGLPDASPGAPSMADFDGDGGVELAVADRSVLAVFEIDGTLVWEAPIEDSSGLAGCSAYDFDGDGAYEVTYADETAFRIYAGADGAVLFEDTGHESATLFEYPVIADVDRDGSAEIVVAEGGSTRRGVTVYGHSTSGWARSGATWGIHDFAMTNLGPDGTIPSPPEPSWHAYNVFRGRPAADPVPLPDLSVAIPDVCVADCTCGPVAVAVQVTNQGSGEAEAGAVLRLYAVEEVGERLVASTSLPAVPAEMQLEGVRFDLSVGDLGCCGWIARVDEEGRIDECDEANNDAELAESTCP